MTTVNLVQNRTRHAIDLREAMLHVTNALGEGSTHLATVYMSWARDHAKAARRAAQTRAEIVAADYMQNFVADMATVMRRDGIINPNFSAWVSD